MQRFVGIDAGAETVKLAEVEGEGGALAWTRRALVEHGGDPAAAVREVLEGWGWDGVAGARATGRLGRRLELPRIPPKQARTAGHVRLHGAAPATVVDLGAHGFSVLVHEAEGRDRYRENPRCSQGTGNFLRQLVERFGLTPAQADALAVGAEAAPLSGRCPVILKTDMTHLANRGEARERILAGLFDAICANVLVFVRPGSPRDVWLTGGVSRSRRVRACFREALAGRGLDLRDGEGDEALYLDALGCALLAAARPEAVPPLEGLFRPPEHASFDALPPLAGALSRVRRVPRPPPPAGDGPILLGLDIGSTGSKAVALDLAAGMPAWEAYTGTSGDPVRAAQSLVSSFLEGPCARRAVVGAGVTGSGREIVGSLLASCFGTDRVFVLNEIAAHAEGACAYDPRVDTIFEIGGQDAKYIRLEGGRVVDAAMNEACSAGTGSFIEEQGRRLGGLDAAALGREAIGADGCVALGQHCAVFMAEILDQAAAAGAPRAHVVAGLYESVVQNYVNRVKGARPVGQVVFCQGMPFSADALAAAVARQTGAEVIVPPSPGTVGAFGIARLARAGLAGLDAHAGALDLSRFLAARVERKDTFVCRSAEGCGGAGNRCRIERLRTAVGTERRAFTWGGACALFDQGTRARKLPAGAPDPFREREAAVRALVEGLGTAPAGAPRVALADAFQLKTLLAYFGTFFRTLGLGVEVLGSGGREALRQGIDLCNVPFCAPMQQVHGVAAALAATGAEHLFFPMIRDLPRVRDERHTWLCPMVHGAPDVLAADLGEDFARRLVAPTLNAGGAGYLDSERFVASMDALAARVGVRDRAAARRAHQAAREAQRAFDARLEAIGAAALERCRADGLLAVVVLGRTYTIHDEVLNANVPALLREQGAVAIPLDCFPLDGATPLVPGAFWSYTQRILRTAHRVRRTPGVYAIFTSNYGCGPDSFTQHHLARLLDGKPFAIVETDGHAADAGTKTRVEAFLHCVREDLRGCGAEGRPAAEPMPLRERTLADVRADGTRVLVPPMGPEAEALAAAFRGVGLHAEVLPPATADTIRLGRRHTSGKECLPMTITAGALLEHLAREPEGRFTFFMPGSSGPCRFGMYRQLHRLILERAGLSDRVEIWSPPDHDYFEGVPPGLGAIVLAGASARGALADALRDARPVERTPGAANAIHARGSARLLEAIERGAAGDLSARTVLREVLGGGLWGIRDAVAGCARELADARDPRPYPTVQIVGEIYVRSDPASNGYVADELERRGVRVRLEPVVEYLQYSEAVQFRRGLKGSVGDHLKRRLRQRIVNLVFRAAGEPLGWPAPEPPHRVAREAQGYLREDLEHESVLAMGLALEAWRHRGVDGILCAGPLDCMPTRLAEAQLYHAAAREGLLSLTLAANGDPIDPEILDGFAYEVKERFARRQAGRAASARPSTGSGRAEHPEARAR
ncbi:CoA-substrate-specific enzyme activase [Anaeromyxobacter dehalogenans 2CP-1]|uniref:CoA-substrate-specific enzyme activase n=1 Tax=Anaeromyxobacter dehalogenans (strain ATCC BAA-258 / DSM 21875 / 2CP-1) TaxID=455488 RepID=B8J8J5_ANAD2|nr:acyl-CoA dehydratase activase-related protein [Anaeromyxobacter dehalogenans]ACL67281.1 CoA-substrate-specific enzyme activase [Anaeromyxobacter dehalogenans 2CP-1]